MEHSGRCKQTKHDAPRADIAHGVSTHHSAKAASVSACATSEDPVGGTRASSSSNLTADQLLRIHEQRSAAIRRRGQRAFGQQWTVQQLLRVYENRMEAMRRRSSTISSLHQGKMHKQAESNTNELRLARMNSHARDARIVFYEEEHYYVLDDEKRFPLSVSGVLLPCQM